MTRPALVVVGLLALAFGGYAVWRLVRRPVGDDTPAMFWIFVAAVCIALAGFAIGTATLEWAP